MSLTGLVPVVDDDPDVQQALGQAASVPTLGGDFIAPVSLRPLLVAALSQAAGASARAARTAAKQDARAAVTLAVTATAREAEELAAALGSLIGEDNVGYFPAWETLPHERLSPRSDTSGQRLAVLRRL